MFELPSYMTGLLGPAGSAQAQDSAINTGLLGALGSLLAASGPQARPIGAGQAIGGALLGGVNSYQGALQQKIQDQLQAMQIGELMRKQNEREAVRQFLPNLYETQVTPEQNLFEGKPTQYLTKDESGNFLPGMSVQPAQASTRLNMNTLQRMALAAPEAAAPYMQSLAAFKALNEPKTATLGRDQVVIDLNNGTQIASGTPQSAIDAMKTGANPFSALINSGSLHPSVAPIAQQYAASLSKGMLNPLDIDKRYAEVVKMSGDRYSQEEGRNQTKILAQGQQDLRQQMLNNQPMKLNDLQKADLKSLTADEDAAKKAAGLADLADRALIVLPLTSTSKFLTSPRQAYDASSNLNFLSQQMVLASPKLSGPQSDKDAARLEAAQGALNSSSTTIEAKQKALLTIKEIAQRQEAYAQEKRTFFENNNYRLNGFKFVNPEAPNAGGQLNGEGGR
jgi:hypothetical protein